MSFFHEKTFKYEKSGGVHPSTTDQYYSVLNRFITIKNNLVQSRKQLYRLHFIRIE